MRQDVGSESYEIIFTVFLFSRILHLKVVTVMKSYRESTKAIVNKSTSEPQRQTKVMTLALLRLALSTL